MNISKRRITLAIGIAALVTLAAASSWEGSAMVGTYGDFPSSGYYAACNSFARNTSVEVVNLENNKTITVIVTMGLDTPGVFMMLSLEASQALGLKAGRIARIRASEPRSAVELAPSSGSGASFDPDLNPRLLAAAELKRLGYELAPSGSAVSTVKPATSSPRVAPAAAAAPLPSAAEPVVPPAAVTTTKPAAEVLPPAVAATTKPAVTEVPVKPSTIELDTPAGITPASSAMAVAEPSPLGSEKPQSVASSKPKPVRTVLLPQLPEPSIPAPAAAAVPAPVEPAVMVSPMPETLAFVLPAPDETPIRITPPTAPRRYETPAVRPEVSVLESKAPASPPVDVSLSEPYPVGETRALAYARSVPGLIEAVASAELVDPSTPSSEKASAITRLSPVRPEISGEYPLSDPFLPATERAEAIYLGKPSMSAGAAGPELAWPELEADEIPEVVLALLSAPLTEIPATSLAEGEIVLPAVTGPSALAMETPAYGAAETSVALEDAEIEPEETATAETLAGLDPYTADASVELAEAEQKPDEVPTVVTAAGVDPYSLDTTVALAEAEAKQAETPVVLGTAGTTPVVSTSVPGLPDAAEQVPDTSPYVAGPAGSAIPPVTLEQPREYIVAIEPTEPKPPVSTPAPAVVETTVKPVDKPAVTVAPAATAPAATAPALAATEVLKKGYYYIQIGAYRSEASAKDAISAISPGFAVLVQKMTEKGKDTWRVFIGPLSRDESGLALVRIRAMGYKDAFLKSGG